MDLKTEDRKLLQLFYSRFNNVIYIFFTYLRTFSPCFLVRLFISVILEGLIPILFQYHIYWRHHEKLVFLKNIKEDFLFTQHSQLSVFLIEKLELWAVK